MKVAEAVGRAVAEAGVDHVFGVVGSGNFHLTNALVAASTPGSFPPGMKAGRRRWPMPMPA